MTGLKGKLDELQAKAKERTVKTQTIEYDLETIVKKIDKKVIQLNPEYQRNHRWDEEFSSRLIESLVLNIPVPFIYISQDVDVDDDVDEGVARYSVIDGQQRLTAIHDFFKNKFSLCGLDVLKDLNGSSYKDLPPFLVRRLEERTIRCLRIDSTIDPQVKYDIFERLNSGSVKLEPQELRNATCRGAFKELIKELSKEADFAKSCLLKEGGAKVKKMEDQELVLRFFALSHNDGYLDYKGGFRKFLTDKMVEFNRLSDGDIEKMKEEFLRVFSIIASFADPIPFAKFKDEGGSLVKVSNFNAAVYDALSVSVSKAKTGVDIDINDFRKVFFDADFFSSVEGSVNDVSKLSKRINKAIEVLR